MTNNTFQPKILKKSTGLAANQRGSERIEDRLLKHGKDKQEKQEKKVQEFYKKNQRPITA
jgi:hypothetical protein